MKTLNDYLAVPYRMEIVESAVANAQDAKKAWFEAVLE